MHRDLNSGLGEGPWQSENPQPWNGWNYGKVFQQTVEEFLTACEVVRLWDVGVGIGGISLLCKEMEECSHTPILEPQAAKPEAV